MGCKAPRVGHCEAPNAEMSQEHAGQLHFAKAKM